MLMAACSRLEGGDLSAAEAFADASDFFRVFADQYHHGKEERQLFRKMVFRGMSAEIGPIAAMLREHDEGRAYVTGIEAQARAELGKRTRKELLRLSSGYATMLRQHIQKEDNVLYPMADKILTESDMADLRKGFREIEAKVMGPEVHEHYRAILGKWESRLALPHP